MKNKTQQAPNSSVGGLSYPSGDCSQVVPDSETPPKAVCLGRRDDDVLWKLPLVELVTALEEFREPAVMLIHANWFCNKPADLLSENQQVCRAEGSGETKAGCERRSPPSLILGPLTSAG